MESIKSFTSLEQSCKLAEILSIESADYHYITQGKKSYFYPYSLSSDAIKDYDEDIKYIPCWSLAALLKLIPKRILRKDKIHCGQAFISSFRWEISPTAIYYTDGNNIMDYVSFRYGENNIELIDAMFKMIVWLKENSRL